MTGSAGPSDPIAVVGLACRLPQAPDPAAYWALLQAGRATTGEIPRERWNHAQYYSPDPTAPGKCITRYGSFIDGIYDFDPLFFKISPREALDLDPQQRLILELAWEAVEDAGIVHSDLAGSATGVYVGASWTDYMDVSRFHPQLISQHTSQGGALSLIANRVSYLMALRGPSLTVDAACASSLVTVQLACQSLHSGETNLALAGGVNLILSPSTMVGYSKFGGLAADGRCKAFDAGADGFGRGEGGGLVVLKRLHDAQRDRDRIHALILGGAVQTGSGPEGIAAPSQATQVAVLREAYRKAGANPATVQYVEAHGTGTALGDPVEANALVEVLCVGRDPQNPLRIGSAKTNLGHLESAAGVAGLIKAVLSIRHAALLPSLHFHTPNPKIPFAYAPIQVQTKNEPWPAGPLPRLAGVSAFGYGGSAAHVIVGQAPAAGDDPGPIVRSAAELWTLSTYQPASLPRAAARLAAALTTDPALTLADVAYTLNSRRTHFPHRLAVIAADVDEAGARLQLAAHGGQHPDLFGGSAAVTGKVGKVFYNALPANPYSACQRHEKGRRLRPRSYLSGELPLPCARGAEVT